MSSDPEQEYFSDGITEDIITALSRVPDMLVIARNSTFAYKGKAVKVQQVSKDLAVRYVLEGSVRKAGNRVRITAQLIDATTGNHLWADRYDRDLEDIFALQDEITKTILTALHVSLIGDSGFQVYARGTNSIEAQLISFTAYRNMYETNKNNNSLARQLAEQIISLDPNWVGGYTILALTHIADIRHGWSDSIEQSFKKAEELAQKVFAIDPAPPAYHTIMITLHWLKNEFPEAIALCEESIKKEPNISIVYSMYGVSLAYIGHYEEAILNCKKGVRLNPFDFQAHSLLGASYFWAGQYANAINSINKALEVDSDNVWCHVWLAAALSLMGKTDQAQSEIDYVLVLDPNYSLNDLTAVPYPSELARKRVFEALRKAGLQ